MTLDRAACLCDCEPTKGHFCSFLVSNIFLNPLFLLSAVSLVPTVCKLTSINILKRESAWFVVAFSEAARWQGIEVFKFLANAEQPFCLCLGIAFSTDLTVACPTVSRRFDRSCCGFFGRFRSKRIRCRLQATEKIRFTLCLERHPCL